MLRRNRDTSSEGRGIVAHGRAPGEGNWGCSSPKNPGHSGAGMLPAAATTSHRGEDTLEQLNLVTCWKPFHLT